MLAGLIACSTPAAPTAPVAARQPRAAWRVRPPGGTQAIDPGVPSGAEQAAANLLDAQACATCHAAIAGEWAASRHALAWTNGLFQREYAARPLAWCVNCHAPLTTQQAGRFRERGVDCATCHVRGGAIVATHQRGGSPHATVEDPSFGSSAFCADCHQFTFPVLTSDGAVTRMTAYPMQTTVASFRAGPYAAQPAGCLTCHGSRANHAFPGGHDPAMLDVALEVTWCRRGAALDAASVLEVGVRNAGAGHSVPTGDIHRHMALRVWRSSAPEALFEAFYGRRFEPADDGGKTTVWDSTIAPGATTQHAIAPANLGGDAGEPVNLELTYVFVENELLPASQAPGEPLTSSIVRWRATPAELTACPRSP